jgi:hypothetical protein
MASRVKRIDVQDLWSRCNAKKLAYLGVCRPGEGDLFFPETKEVNLMPQSGPTTEAGKLRSSLNSVRHGLNSTRFLPCKRQRCYYWLGCPCREPGGRLPDTIVYGTDCPNEISSYRVLVEQYGKALGGADTDRSDEIHQLAMNQIRLMRVKAALAINPTLIRRIPSVVPGYDRPAPALPWRYRHELTKVFYEQLSKSFPYIKGII